MLFWIWLFEFIVSEYKSIIWKYLQPHCSPSFYKFNKQISSTNFPFLYQLIMGWFCHPLRPTLTKPFFFFFSKKMYKLDCILIFLCRSFLLFFTVDFFLVYFYIKIHEIIDQLFCELYFCLLQIEYFFATSIKKNSI